VRCTSPRTVGFLPDGKTISWSPKNYSKEYAPFQLPCSKCIECRLEYARQWAIRCVHEAKMHEDNSFITLTYSNNNLKSDKLIYKDYQDFMKRLRSSNPHKEIGMFVTGEYGEKTKRPHWHALLFNYRPDDLIYKYSNERGDRIYSSDTLSDLWSHGISECGQVTFESAGYCARYAAKKLVHGNDGHEYEPISKKSSKHAIGKSYLEKYWPDIFNQGQVILPNGQSASIPRYYEKWLMKNHPIAWDNYVTENKLKKIKKMSLRSHREHEDYIKASLQRELKGPEIKRTDVRKKIIEERFKRLQKFQKGDI